MTPREYYRTLERDAREDYARRVGTSVGYLRYILKPIPGTTPRRPLMEKLADESDGRVSRAEVIEYFYG